MDGRLITGVAAATGGISLAEHPVLGFLVGAGILIGRVLIKLIQVKLDYDDIERGPNSEVSWVYEALRGIHRGRE